MKLRVRVNVPYRCFQSPCQTAAAPLPVCRKSLECLWLSASGMGATNALGLSLMNVPRPLKAAIGLDRDRIWPRSARMPRSGYLVYSDYSLAR